MTGGGKVLVTSQGRFIAVHKTGPCLRVRCSAQSVAAINKCGREEQRGEATKIASDVNWICTQTIPWDRSFCCRASEGSNNSLAIIITKKLKEWATPSREERTAVRGGRKGTRPACESAAPHTPEARDAACEQAPDSHSPHLHGHRTHSSRFFPHLLYLKKKINNTMGPRLIGFRSDERLNARLPRIKSPCELALYPRFTQINRWDYMMWTHRTCRVRVDSAESPIQRLQRRGWDCMGGCITWSVSFLRKAVPMQCVARSSLRKGHCWILRLYLRLHILTHSFLSLFLSMLSVIVFSVGEKQHESNCVSCTSSGEVNN